MADLMRPNNPAKGIRNAKWKGGTKIHAKDYIQVTAGPCRGQMVHILVAEAMLGRELRYDLGEEVHHKDGDRLNPKWWNLEVKTNKVDHHAADARRRKYGSQEPEIPIPEIEETDRAL